VRDASCHSANTLNHDVGRAAWRNRGTIASLAATGACAVPAVGWASCAGLQAGAFAVRAQQRGVTHYAENGADLTLSAGSFALVSVPSGQAGEGMGLGWWGQRALNTVTGGAVSGAGYLGAYLQCHVGVC
jgi:hypothetical protein